MSLLLETAFPCPLDFPSLHDVDDISDSEIFRLVVTANHGSFAYSYLDSDVYNVSETPVPSGTVLTLRAQLFVLNAFLQLLEYECEL